MTKTFCVVLTGGIGSGKSTVSALFRKLGTPIIDSDIISREIVQSGKPALEKIIHLFGQEIVNEDRTLNREKLSDIVFHDSSCRKKLEDILHPEIYREINRKILQIKEPYCIVVIPLFVEKQTMMKYFDRVLLTDVSKELQIERTAKRDNIPTDAVFNIINIQVKRDIRLNYADDIIDNTGKIDELGAIVDTLHKKYLELSYARYL